MWDCSSTAVNWQVFCGLQAQNDPIAPSRGIPREDIKVCAAIQQMKPSCLFFPFITWYQVGYIFLWWRVIRLLVDWGSVWLTLSFFFVAVLSLHNFLFPLQITFLMKSVTVISGKPKLFVNIDPQRWSPGMGCRPWSSFWITMDGSCGDGFPRASRESLIQCFSMF